MTGDATGAGHEPRVYTAITRAVLAEYLNADDMRTTIECLFGDAAARTLGFTPHGLSPWAGIALALHDALTSPRTMAWSP